MADTITRGPVEEVANAFFQGSATSGSEYFVVGPVAGPGRLKRLIVDLGSLTAASHVFGASVAASDDRTLANYLSGTMLLQGSTLSQVGGGSKELIRKMSQSIPSSLELALSHWVTDGAWYVICHAKETSAGVRGTHLVSVVWDRYFV